MRSRWGKRSFRFWVGVGMALALGPLTVSAIGGYFVLKHGVMEPFADAVEREHHQVGGVHRLQLLLRETSVPIDHFVDKANPAGPGAFRVLRQQIELGFANLVDALDGDAEALTLVSRAREDWTLADRVGTEILSSQRPAGDEQQFHRMEEYDGLISAAVDKLAAAGDKLHQEIDADHDAALRAYERSEWIAGIAAAVSLLLIAVSIYIIGHMLLTNIDRLVEGATRFAEGDRDHRIDIQVPPELTKVADEFNYMITRIRQAEQALADQARRDVLTGLLNRRSFDEALSEALARVKRLDERFSLILFDLDHFKRVNDTYGHARGDAVLKDIAHRVTKAVREVDKVFRFGGEEFALLLPGLDQDEAMAAAERLRALVAAEPVRADGDEIPVTASMGVAVSGPTADAKSLVDAADQALYRAKAEGRNNVKVGV